MNFRSATLVAFLLCTAFGAQAAEPVKILLITGGCCHDYEYQTKTMREAFVEHGIDVDWKVIHEGGSGTEAEIGLYDNPDWAKGFDVVIHNECFANTKSEAYIRKITDTHKKGTNAVVIHCAMHTYRASQVNDWREFLGVTSRKHDHQSNYPVKVIEKEHPIMKGFPSDWVTPKDELYIIETLWPHATPLATSVSEKDGSSHPCFWTNEYGESKVFGTTYGHSNETFADKVFQQALVRGTLWAAGKLEDADKAVNAK
jgi:uncharacterized protein